MSYNPPSPSKFKNYPPWNFDDLTGRGHCAPASGGNFHPFLSTSLSSHQQGHQNRVCGKLPNHMPAQTSKFVCCCTVCASASIAGSLSCSYVNSSWLYCPIISPQFKVRSSQTGLIRETIELLPDNPLTAFLICLLTLSLTL